MRAPVGCASGAEERNPTAGESGDDNRNAEPGAHQVDSAAAVGATEHPVVPPREEVQAVVHEATLTQADLPSGLLVVLVALEERPYLGTVLVLEHRVDVVDQALRAVRVVDVVDHGLDHLGLSVFVLDPVPLAVEVVDLHGLLLGSLLLLLCG